MGKSKHDRVAERLAKKEGVKYNRGQGADIQSSRRAIEVEGVNTIGDATRQLAGYQKPVYVAGADAKATQKALEHYKGTTIGVIAPSGKTVRCSTRGRRK